MSHFFKQKCDSGKFPKNLYWDFVVNISLLIFKTKKNSSPICKMWQIVPMYLSKWITLLLLFFSIFSSTNIPLTLQRLIFLALIKKLLIAGKTLCSSWISRKVRTWGEVFMVTHPKVTSFSTSSSLFDSDSFLKVLRYRISNVS